MASALERGIVDAFAADAGIDALMGGRLFPMELPDSNRIFPAGVYQIIDNPRQATQDGDSGTTFARVQFRLYAHTYLETVAMRNAIVSAYSGTKPAGFGSPAVLLTGWFIENERDEIATELQQSGVNLFSKRLDITIHTTDI